MKRIALIAVAALAIGCEKQEAGVWQGYIEGEYVLLASPYAGQLQKLFVRRGDQVESGKPVFALEQENERAARAEAEERMKSAQAKLENLQAARRQAAWRLEQKSVAAPVSGLVQDTFFVIGEWVPAGRPVASLLPPGNVKARFYVPETVLSSVQIGKTIEIRCDGCQALDAKVSYVSSQAEYTPPVLYSKESRSKLLFLVEARLPNAQLRPGQPVDVRFK